MEIFNRSKLNPILKPSKNKWENEKLYNPGVIYYNGKYHMFYRAIGDGKDWKSSIGYAVSDDGVDFKRFNKPLLTGENKFETRGIEDPRITKLDDKFIMIYASYNGITPRLSMAKSRDLKNWEKHGPILKGFNFEEYGGKFIKFQRGKVVIKKQNHEWSKSGAIFPEKINGYYHMLFGEYCIWMAKSKDLVNWKISKKPWLKSRKGMFFDNTYVEMGPPPIRTNKGWLVIYHGVNKEAKYQIGYVLTDLKNPKKILHRTNKPIFSPRENYELSGIIDIVPGGIDELNSMNKKERNEYINNLNKKNYLPQVIFCCGTVVSGDKLKIYYGAGDSVICMAEARLKEVLSA